MNAKPQSALHPWSKDLEASRDVHPRQRDGFAMVLGWFETFRSRNGLAPGRDACVRFWTEQVKVKERPAWSVFAALRRDKWKLEVAR